MLLKKSKSWWIIALGSLALLVMSACAGAEGSPVLRVGGIPDQDTARLARRYQVFAAYLSEKLGVKVEYVPSANYAAVVTAFGQGDLQLAFFGGLTGVQARLQNPGSQAIAQRREDARFHSKFIARADLPLNSLADLKARAEDLSITFGSESSTSGHLMPRHFLDEAGIDAESGFKLAPNFSGSHDLTWKLVASGAFDVGTLNEHVWERAVAEGRADPSKVREFYTTPEYFDYNWTVPASLDQLYGEGFTDRVRSALLALSLTEHREILDLFSTEGFIESNNSNYGHIEEVGRSLGIIR